MEIARDSLDDLLAETYTYILDNGIHNEGSKKGPNLDTIGVTLRLSSPRARLSRSVGRGKPFSALGELLWYLSGSNRASFISGYHSYYRDGPERVPDAYGPRLRGHLPEKGFAKDQLAQVINALRNKAGTRQAIIQIYDSTDQDLEGDIPCTTNLQFQVRDGALHMIATMRSNDAFIGLPHDLFCFTMLQEIIAVETGFRLGEYVHFAGSLHIYDHDMEAVRAYLREGFHRIAPMPPMVCEQPLQRFNQLIAVERMIRSGVNIEFGSLRLEPYFEDLARLIYANFRGRDKPHREFALSGLHHREYHTYIDNRRRKGAGVPPPAARHDP